MTPTISSILADIASDASRTSKEQKLKALASTHPIFVRVLERAYSPRFSYYIKQVEQANVGTKALHEVWDTVDALLTRLASREVSGHAAKAEVTAVLDTLTKDEGDVLIRILQGDLACGINVSSINKAIPRLLPEYPYMRCSLMKGSNIANFCWDRGVYSQEKADGQFVNVSMYPDGSVSFMTRAGTVYPMDEFHAVVAELQATVGSWGANHQFHGEMVVMVGDTVLPREVGNGILNSVQQGGKFEPGQYPRLMLWDVIPLEHAQPDGRYDVEYAIRFGKLEGLTGTYVGVIPTRVVYSLEEAYAHYVELLNQNKEGTVIKNPTAIWRDATSKDQIKLKLEVEVDLIVRGFNAGTGKNAKLFGSIEAESSCGKLRVNLTGFSDKLRKEIDAVKDEWVDNQIITVRSNSILYHNGVASLFLPRFVEARLDKTTADDLDKIITMFEEAKAAPNKKKGA